jgi:Carboxypeptidase regulatory-like domain
MRKNANPSHARPSSLRFPSSLFGFLAILLAAISVGVQPAAAQATSGATGVVTDPSGAVVTDAAVTLSNAAIGFSASTKTNGVGVYEFLNVPPSETYTLSVSKDGFRTSTLERVILNVATKATQDVQLMIGTAQANVEVTSRVGETLNTTDASLGSIIDADRVQDLPNIFVNQAGNYLSLAPGVTPGGAVTGTRSDQTNITLDGLDVNDQRGGFAFSTTVNTPLDSIQELKATVTGDDVTYGHSAGGQLELVTKSGTNQFHGQAFELNRVTAYAANNYFNNLQGVPNPQLIRNQFGADVGGPIRKDKLFFFISYNGLRAKQSQQINDIIPDPNVLNGQLNYINTSGNVVTTPVSGANSLTNLDPCFPAGTCPGVTPGPDTALLTFLQQRGYVNPNNTAVGDGLNTAGLFFVAPVNNKDNTTVARLDYQVTNSHRLFARGTWDRSSDDDSVNHTIQIFPGDPAPLASIVDHSRSWVVGDTWLVSPNITNQVSFGETVQVLAFPVNFKPTLPNVLTFFDGFFGNVLTDPFTNAFGYNEQFPNVPVYQVRDTFTWTRGKHVFQFGGFVAPTVFKSGNLTDTTTYSVGIGGALGSLTPAQRPSDIGARSAEWDRLYALELGLINTVSAGYNYDKAGNALPQGGIPIRDYHATQYEFFAQDTWQLRSDLTLTWGLHWGFHNPLSEVNGFEAVPNLAPFDIFGPRVKQAAQGISGPDAVPFLTYSLGGSANNGPEYYRADYKNFAPRIGIAYSPDSSAGFLGKLFGNRQTSIRAGFGIDFDNTLIGQGFELDETSFMFSNTVPAFFSDPTSAPRVGQPGSFGSLGPGSVANLPALPAAPPGGTTPRPTFTPNVFNGFPYGFFDGGFGQGAFYNFDPNYKTPYEMHFSFGIQRELPGNWLVEATYVGKLGRRLTALADPAQTLNFKDATTGGPAAPGQFLYDAFGAVQSQIQAGANPNNGTGPGTPLTPQPWFENQMTSALEANFGATCPDAANAIFGDPTLQNMNCTNLAGALAGPYFGDGDVSSAILIIADEFGPFGGLLAPNVALLAQNGAAGYIGNFSSSNYNALVIRVNHKFSNDFTMEANYTYSHSIDNDSGVQNALISFANAEICDLRNLRVCRGSSDFDHRHILAANFIYGLPIGRGRWLGSNMSKLLDEAIGGWKVSGIVTAYTGAPFKVDSGAFTIDFTQTQPGVFIGSKSDVAKSVHQVPSGQTGVPNTVQFFSDPNNAFGAFTAPIAGGPGNRNILNGPNFWNIDMSLLKEFTMPWSENQKLQFRADAFNVFNHTNFSAPGAELLNSPTFGNITSTANDARQLQLGLKFSF